MINFTDKEKELLLRVFNELDISQLVKMNHGEHQTLEGMLMKLNPAEAVELYVDGAANLNAKSSGIGGCGLISGEEVFSFSRFTGDMTNNQAEYLALIHGLELALANGYDRLSVKMDSELVVRQVNGAYKVKNERMIPLHQKVQKLLKNFTQWEIRHVPRNENARADYLSKQGLNDGVDGG